MQELKCLLKLIHTRGVGPASISKLVERYRDPCEALRKIGEWFKGTFNLPFDIETRIEELLARIEQHSLQVITIWDEAYPLLLREIHAPPPILYAKGNLDLLNTPSVAIVGTRKPSRYGRETTRIIAGALADAGLTIVSGLALGIDAEAHRAALQQGGNTIAVLPSPLTGITPASNKKLAEEISGKGLLVSEVHPGTRLSRSNFYLRNRIISGLSKFVIVTEAPEKSGALITARFALEQNREIYSVPGPINSPKSMGSNLLIKEGATPFISVEDFLNDIGLQKNSHIIQLPELEERERRLLDMMGREIRHFDELLGMGNFSFGELTGILMSLENKGYIEEIGGNFYKRKI